MSSTTYPLNVFDQLLNHGWRKPWFVRDGHDNHPVHNEAELRAQVASSDYFAMLATNLDQISQNLRTEDVNDYVLLDKVINDLLFLHQHYKITKK
jgi:hypothetical protein